MWVLLLVCAALIWYWHAHRPIDSDGKIALGFSILITGLYGLNSINMGVLFLLAIVGFSVYVLMRIDKKQPPTIG